MILRKASQFIARAAISFQPVVFFRAQQQQIFDSIISLVAIDVVNLFVRMQRAADILLHHPSVLSNLPAIRTRNSDIAARCSCPFAFVVGTIPTDHIRVLACLRTESHPAASLLCSLDYVARTGERLAAGFAVERHLRGIIVALSRTESTITASWMKHHLALRACDWSKSGTSILRSHGSQHLPCRAGGVSAPPGFAIPMYKTILPRTYTAYLSGGDG